METLLRRPLRIDISASFSRELKPAFSGLSPSVGARLLTWTDESGADVRLQWTDGDGKSSNLEWDI